MKEIFEKIKVQILEIATENPWKGMALALVVGFVLGAIIL